MHNVSTKTREAVEQYYDGTINKRLSDYVYANPRVAAGIGRAKACISRNTKSVLDIGCGIGVSSHAMASCARRVLGVDISPESIRVARLLFPAPQLAFEVHDMRSVPTGGPYDLITLFDVYEHVPRESWPSFNDVLAVSLGDSGTLLLTTPSVMHQEFLAREHPERLQIIDETVALKDIETLADRLDALIVSFDHVSVWHTNDYVHAVLQRGAAHGTIPPETRHARPGRLATWIECVQTRRRRQRVYRALGAVV